MHDKYVRRRRAVLALLVVVVFIVVVAVFGAAENSPLHPIQQGISKVAKPIADGASVVVSPVRGIGHWVSTTLHAKSQNAGLKSRNASYNRQLAETGIAIQENAELKGMLAITKRLKLNQDAPVYADVDSYNPDVYYQSIGIDKGAEDGIRVGDPVIGQYGLVGDITAVHGSTATVSGLNSKNFGVYAQINDPSGKGGSGTLEPEVGHPLNLQVNFVAASAQIANGDKVVTATFSVKSNPMDKSRYPANIPIGTVTNFDFNQLTSDGTVDVSPSVNMHNLSEVEVLTDVKTS